jgi:glycerol uptake facilitator-like aquaporin
MLHCYFSTTQYLIYFLMQSFIYVSPIMSAEEVSGADTRTDKVEGGVIQAVAKAKKNIPKVLMAVTIAFSLLLIIIGSVVIGTASSPNNVKVGVPFLMFGIGIALGYASGYATVKMQRYGGPIVSDIMSAIDNPTKFLQTLPETAQKYT